ncbi:uncharacterized protein LOC134252064 [Saccostrea cucullata]|uniref:uncharacterized protein LOC134252064 n=1 Tax=Saccostrea cuccullata TaxID=36930 RepID=UPI002ED1C201
MYWLKQNKVIWDLNQAQFYNDRALIFANCTDSPPGFTLLQLLSPNIHCKAFITTCIPINGKFYISSSKHKQMMCFFQRKCCGGNCVQHGPCVSDVSGNDEIDMAWCFASDFWPPSAFPWIERCHNWPPPRAVQDIVNKGCHFVAIGHKLGNHEHDEWRISFSLAEQKLVFEMNHCQFLVYGLLKILTKEIFHRMLGNEGKLLCSYHMKTAVFWGIQHNIIYFWCPQNLLECFWVCFKLILKWVYEGVCPNFFIPENNMFLHNIYGEAQKNLFNNLYALYQKGIAFLLLSPSINFWIITSLLDPRRICTEYIRIFEDEFDPELFTEISKKNLVYDDLPSCMRCLITVEKLISSHLTEYHVIMLLRSIADIFQATAFILHELNKKTGLNKRVYVADKTSCYMVKQAAKFGFISDMLYTAIYYYKTLRYVKSLFFIKTTKLKLTRPYILRSHKVADKSYTEALGGKPLSTKMRQAVAMHIIVDGKTRYINELVPEIASNRQNGMFGIAIADRVMLLMLEILCYIHIDRKKAHSALNDLQDLVHRGEVEIEPGIGKDIAWQILGICQQMTGNHKAALYSYLQSLQQDPIHRIQTATLIRILTLYSDLRRYRED